MKLSLNWLNEYTHVTETPAVLANRISASLAEVEDIHEIVDTFDGVVIGKIVDIAKHPNADKLQLTKVDVGKETLSIVCGAPNIAVGDYVPVILVGNTLPNTDLRIEAREVRGEVSHGMLCSPRELGISNDHSGIMLLNAEPGIKVGERFDSLFETKDVIIEIENKALTHRPDTFSHRGIARELATMFGSSFSEKLPDKIPLSLDMDIELDLAIQNAQLCRRYTGIIIPNVTIKPSPLWLQQRLRRIGTRPVNNIVDITNYIMYDMGQPLHAFDRNTLASDTIIVRTATPHEQITTLDGQTRELTQEMLVIADEEKPIALAGIMGGIDTEVTDTTNSIILESANFEHFTIRKTSRQLGLQTEAVIRFSKNQDPSTTEPALLKALELLKEYGDVTTSSLDADFTSDQTYVGREERIIPFSADYINQKIGGTKLIHESEIKKTLTHLGIEVVEHGKHLGAVPPTFRPDLTIPEDIVEEIARIIGYDNITPTLPYRDISPATANKHILWQRRIKQLAVRLGFTETYNYSFVGKALYDKCRVGESLEIKLANPVAPEAEYIRPSLVPQLLENIAHNKNTFNSVRLFELERRIKRDGFDLPREEDTLAMALYQKEGGYTHIKGIVDQLLATLHIPGVRYEQPKTHDPFLQLLDEQRAAAVFAEEELLGYIGEIHPEVQIAFGLSQTVGVAELNADVVFELTDTGMRYKPVSPHPSIAIDISCIVHEDISLDSLLEIAKKSGSEFLQDAAIYHVQKYPEKFGAEQKAITMRLTYQAPDRSLSKVEIADNVQAIIQELQNKFDCRVQ